ncbi:hypothetical protein V8C44DRAFT_346313 [Trichoderma aethiopicum]
MLHKSAHRAACAGEGVFTFGSLGTPCLPRRLSSAQRHQGPWGDPLAPAVILASTATVWFGSTNGGRTKGPRCPYRGSLCHYARRIVASRMSRGTSGCKAMFEVDERGREVRMFRRPDPHQDGPKRRD